MRFEKNIALSLILTLSMISSIFITLPVQTSAPALTVKAKPVPGIYELDIYGDASGLYSLCLMFEQFSVSKLKWSARMPTYPPTTYIRMGVTVGSLDFSKVSDTTLSMSIKGLEEAMISVPGFDFLVKCKSGELNMVFSDPYYMYYYWTYRTVDITGTLKGDVVFSIDIPQLTPSFHYEGPELTIDAHIGMTIRP